MRNTAKILAKCAGLEFGELWHESPGFSSFLKRQHRRAIRRNKEFLSDVDDGCLDLDNLDPAFPEFMLPESEYCARRGERPDNVYYFELYEKDVPSFDPWDLDRSTIILSDDSMWDDETLQEEWRRQDSELRYWHDDIAINGPPEF